MAAAPSRPVETSSPDPIQTGVVEVETGLTHSWMTDTSHQFVFSDLIKIGAWCNFEVRWAVNGFVTQNFPISNTQGIGDNFLTSQYRFLRESVRRPSLAVRYTVKFASASSTDGLGSGMTDHLITLMASKTIHGFVVNPNLSHFWIGEPGGRYDGKYEATILVSHALHKRFGLMAEVYGDSRLNAANDAYANSTWALTYAVKSQLVIDGGIYAALTSGPGAPGKSVFLGASYALGNLYRFHGN